MSYRRKILCVLGTRPEAIKMAPVIRGLQQDARFEVLVCSTGQHRSMLAQVLDLFRLPLHRELDVMRPNQTPTDVAAAILQRIGPVYEEFGPDWVLVQGDTVTVAAAALAAFYHRIKVGHVEAGLRTNDRQQPFPEEINRRVAGVLADRHFAATPQAKANLRREGVPAAAIVVTGNTVIDALHAALATPVPPDAEELTDCGGRKIILVTAHRRENLGRPLDEIVAAVRSLAARHRDSVEFVFPVHLNPNVRGPVLAGLSGLPNVRLLDPLDYRTLLHVVSRCHLVLTDSGGLQEEAPALGKPVLVLRETTERPEAVHAGTARLVGTNRERIRSAVETLLSDDAAYARMSCAVNPYGDGGATQRILASLAGDPVSEFTRGHCPRPSDTAPRRAVARHPDLVRV